MFYRTQDIESEHALLRTPGGTAEVMVAAVSSCGQLIEAASRASSEEYGVRVAIVNAMGIRLTNVAIGAGNLFASGLWAPALHCLRDVAETGQLLLFFQWEPDQIEAWAALVGAERNKQFRFGEVHQKLARLRIDSGPWKQRFDAYSNRGSHISSEGLALAVHSDGRLLLLPYADPVKFKYGAVHLAHDLVAATLQWCATMDAAGEGRAAPISERLRYRWACVAGASKILRYADGQDWIDRWR